MVQTPNRLIPISTVSLVLEQLLNGVVIDHPEMSTVYDESLSYDSALKKFRADQDRLGTNKEFLPAFIFNRQPLQYADGLGLRAQFSKPCFINNETGQADQYKIVVGSLDVDFMVLFRTIKEFEKMEALHMAGAGFTSNKLLTVSIPGVGELDYQATYEQPQDKTQSYEGSIYKGYTSRVTLSGSYLFFIGSSGLINDISVSVENFQKTVLMDINCSVG